MRLKIEDWLTTQKVHIEAEQLLQEAIICYKGSAYKASLLFSYLFFQTTLKYRILSNDLPDEINKSDLKELIDLVDKEDKWDKAVFDITNRKKEPSLFKLDDDIRNQLNYWRNRRNDCAHAKSNIIEASTVESFWYFLQSSLPKFYINGGRSALLEKIKIHFTRSKTPEHKDPIYITKEIPLSMIDKEYLTFLKELKEILEQGYGIGGFYEDNKMLLWRTMFNLQENFVAQLVQFLMTENNLNLTRAILKYDPSTVQFFKDYPEFIRSIWFAPGELTEVRVVIALLRLKLIPSDQVEESIVRLIECQAIVEPRDLLEEELKILTDNNFIELFKHYAFAKYEPFIRLFEWANYHKKNAIIWYFEKYGFDKDVVQALYNTFSYESHPWHLRDAIRLMFRITPQLQEQYVSVCEEFEVPVVSMLIP
ncbi:hypothetical protein [Paenibacillus polymyxa]|uniref:hypothetical protein n=1 Tax=Paenibacillus polymyxa TaxID=1406 RepID=UPI002378CF5A|nr:hypothetical protein [Paenibacillus polymyxa]WDM22893.1 hypothetical protein J4I02_04665 [Paenibacillus polymyxa]